MGNETIYTGIWQNHSQSGWRGSTLTLDVRSGSLLISALATFITLVGARFWAIVSFSIHQVRASQKQKDGIHHQHQVVYRNGSSALGTAWAVLEISWAWRKRASCNVGRFFAAALPPVLVFAGFAAASVLSAKVAAPPTGASQVKLVSKNCGYIDSSTDVLGTVSQDNSQIFSRLSVRTAILARNYARNCYDDDSQNLASCNFYPIRRLPYQTHEEATCPFKGDRCILGPQKAFRMQTPWLDSHSHFGINAQTNHRVEWRRTTTCSVLNVTDRVTTRSAPSGKVHTWNLGYSGPLSARSNQTYNYNENAVNFGMAYTVQSNFAVEQDRYSGWVPFDDMLHQDADVSVFFLAPNSVLYPDPIDDPLFSAHRQFSNNPPSSNDTYYGSDELVTVVGCIDQAEIRNPLTGVSTAPLGLQRLSNDTFGIGLNPSQVATSFRLIIPSEQALMFNSVNGVGTTALKAQDSLYIMISSGLPSNQWQIELRGWFDTALARMQASAIDFVSKTEEATSVGKLGFGTSQESTQPMCKNQLVTAIGNYQSFSMMGIEIILAVGLFIVLISFVLERVVGCIHKRWGSHRYKQVRWKADGILQQQRLAFENNKVNGWEKTDDTVPITALGKTWIV
ncbi:hypothetical protein GLAREA_07178 [Glarea lozoyensis ATCC 20868]|uniref:Uncharacterized protein n=1 Tax=Glarea lozoyensis (strain ATCC 20868 / MF5171) TaxID=1116229 RepID=S3D8W6_GLAL2|nr:uncharacterized protein GLAREA_07178 [Glarea lozoyensis ATCC 20868]EPE34165.1 hypothetical protein GLAREA_07178 [Glarea lozoyensis ATCC 20868]